jgi:hypothetical protein
VKTPFTLSAFWDYKIYPKTHHQTLSTQWQWSMSKKKITSSKDVQTNENPGLDREARRQGLSVAPDVPLMSLSFLDLFFQLSTEEKMGCTAIYEHMMASIT